MRIGQLLLITLFFCCVCCSQNEDAAPPSAQSGCLLTKKTATEIYGTVTTTYQYDSGGRLSKMTETQSGSGQGKTTTTSYTYTYTEGLISSVETRVGSGSSTISWTNENGRLIKAGSGSDATAIAYDNDNRVKSSHIGALTSFLDIQTSYAPTGLLRSLVVAAQDATTFDKYTYTYTYDVFDGKKSPGSLLAKRMNQPVFFDNTGLFHAEDVYASNPLSETLVKVKEGTGVIMSENATFVYEYNGNGYPTKITRMVGGVPNNVATFEYQNCN